MRKLFEQRVAGDIALAEAYKKQTGKRGFFNQQYLYENKVSYTLTTHADSIIPFKQPIYLSRSEVCNISTFPQDYHFLNQSPTLYLWNECTTRYDGTSSLTSMEILVI